MDNSTFAHLHNHTSFSVYDGLNTPSQLINAAKKMGFKHIAITDHGNMGGHYQFAKAAYAGDPINPIFGVEAYLCEDASVKEHVPVIDPSGATRMRRPKHFHIVLLAKNDVGYNNLLNLSKIAASEECFYYEPRIDWSHLSQHNEGIVCLSACISGEIGLSISNNSEEETIDVIDKYKQLFKDDFYIELQNHKMQDEFEIYKTAAMLAQKMNVKTVATNDIHYISKEDARGHSILVSMRFRTDEDKSGSSDFKDMTSAYKQPEFYLKSKEEMLESFKGQEASIDNTIEVAEKCNYHLSVNNPIVWPEFKSETGVSVEKDKELIEWRDRYVPEQNLKQAFLTRESFKQMVEKKLNKNIKYVKRFKKELDIIFDLGYEEYFLVQWQICKKCDEMSIMMGPGRGSGGGSLILYLLGITKIDPLQHNLMFERFLNPGRGPMFNHDLPLEAFKTKKLS